MNRLSRFIERSSKALANTYLKTFLALVVLQTLYFGPMIVQRAVFFPHNNGFEVSGLEVADNTGITNRKFSDQSSALIPEINQHLHGTQQAWLSTWNPHVQLGRPTFQMFGLSKAYLLTHILSVFLDNPFILYTCLTLLTSYLTSLFCFLFLKALELHPLACFSIAAGLSLGTFFAYWLTFVMFLATWCWTLALLWLIAEFVKHKSFTIAASIAFASYSLLLTGYPQAIVIHAFLICGFTLKRLWQSPSHLKTKLYTALGLVGAALAGVVTALPAYLDVFIYTQRSVRFKVGDEFFLAVLPSIRSFNELALFLSQLFDAFWFGNVIKQEYPFVFNGLCLTPFYFVLLLLSLGLWRQLWAWQLWVAGCLLATIWAPAYLFMVHYLGFSLSRSIPLGGAIIPAFVLCGYAVDHILRHGFEKRSLFAIAAFVTPLLLSSFVAINQRPKLQTSFVALCLLLTLGTAWFVTKRKPATLILLTIASVWVYGFTIALTQPMSEIQTTSPLVDRIRSETVDGSRYALIGQDLAGILPPNQESLLQVKSIHSYDSLTSTNYQRLMEQLSNIDSSIYRRYFTSVASDAKLQQAAFSYSGVSLLLTRSKLDTTHFKVTGEINGIMVYRSLAPPIQAAQLTNFAVNETGGVVLSGPLNEQSGLQTKKIVAQDDFMKFQMTPSDRETLLFVSQQSHPFWKATSKTIPLSTVTINDFYLGVIIPPYTNEAEIRFSPFVVWSWIPQAIYIVLFFAVMIGKLRAFINARVGSRLLARGEETTRASPN